MAAYDPEGYEVTNPLARLSRGFAMGIKKLAQFRRVHSI